MRRAIEALQSGVPISHLAGLHSGKYIAGTYIVNPDRLRAFCAKHPSLGKRILRLIERNGDAALKKMRQKGNLANAQRFETPAYLFDPNTYAMIRKSVAVLPEAERDDVYGMVVARLLERQIKPKQVEKAVRECAAVSSYLLQIRAVDRRHHAINR